MLLNYFIIVVGLVLFETISSIDNAVVNAHVIKNLAPKYRRFFLVWGLLLAVFVVRGLLPFLIVWLTNPALSFFQIVTFVFSNNPEIGAYVEESKALLMLGGGVYLFFVFLSWLFLEEKNYAFLAEHFIHRQGVWYYAIASLTLTIVVYFAIKADPVLALSATIGATAFFITDGFKQNAAEQEKKLMSSNMSGWSKILYLEVLDASFSIDGVIGAFAFTSSVPLILLGNGLGALVVRQFTIHGGNLITKFAYLKNGAMYSIGVLGGVMIIESFGGEFPFWLAPLNTLLLLVFFLYLSFVEIKKSQEA
ncbi:hypothetical protein COU00_03115 [Candidatus Falkowbacteria bacterium CG10_big_fil_rev_8_21_14_0_10_43_11]|uniref:DUF475 domain-containing protein n=1 Tax=Candidatus Falkowbacteria bacterium CG10_big_fil_rev_8_21_14_0_10_43_11 TaxID=1974568 RepID=A0A2M6WLK3_9BACT|nr:MAG: hypothetical protein COU00_03115 [Candidatus Falkowbacteria bacterium CG10_big_fil_rev_8_21_14_0_10_43_11]